MQQQQSSPAIATATTTAQQRGRGGGNEDVRAAPHPNGGPREDGYPPPPSSHRTTAGTDARQRLRRKASANADDSSFFQQFAACIVKHFNEKRRDKQATALEFGLPILFIVGSIALWAAFAADTEPADQFLSYTAPGPAASPTTSFDLFRATVCVDATTNPGGVNGLPNCNPADASITTCYPEHPLVPVTGLCVVQATDPTLRTFLAPSNFMRYVISGLSKSLIYPFRMDDIILAQWFTKLTGTANTRFFNTPTAAMSVSGNLYFAPNNAATVALVNHFNTTSDLFRYVFGKITETSAEAEGIVTSVDREGKTWGIVNVRQFTAIDFNVQLRLNRTAMPETKEIVNKFYLGGVEPDNSLYVLNGFYTLQWNIAKYYLENVASVGATVDPPMVVPMGYAEYDQQQFLAFGGAVIPLLIVLGFLYPVSQLAKRIVLEKELRIREAMLIMGLGNGAFYSAWIVVYALQHLVTAAIITILLKVTYLTRCNTGVLFFAFFFFELSTISMAGLISAIFSKARLAALVTPLIYFATSIPLFIIEDAQAGTRRMFLILSPTAFANAIQLMFQRELGGGMGSKDITNGEDDPNMLVILFMLAIDTILYFVLWLYADAIAPNDWGTPRTCCYCITDPLRSCWKALTGGCCEDDTKKNSGDDLPDGRAAHGVFEDVVVDERTTVQLVGLRKEFTRGSKAFVAVDNLYWQLREGEISVLLGHNGAGKTTTMNMMTGMLEADAGDCFIYGYSVRHELHMVRREIGYCPQHNVLWPDLTCEEHLRFYGGVKGTSGDVLEKAVTEMLEAVDLMDKRSYKSSELSGGQKRKLSVAIAFVGGSRLVFLDEPTAGMDVGARRHTWNLLRRMAATHTILLSTHFMDEADLLGHSIGIMSSGSLQCSGSSLFLKSRLGVGYNIVLSTDAHVDAKRVDSEVRAHIQDAELLNAGAGEITYRLPSSAVSSFPAMLVMLENQGPSFGIRNYSISATTLEEIFLQIAHGAEEREARMGGGGRDGQHNVSGGGGATDDKSLLLEGRGGGDVEMATRGRQNNSNGHQQQQHALRLDMPADDDDDNNNNNNNQNTNVISSVWKVQRLEPASSALMWTQFEAMMTKRFKNSLRDRRTQCLQIVLPVVCLLLAMLFTLLEFFSAPAIVISPSIYGETTLMDLQGCGTLFDLNLPVPGGVLVRTPTGLSNALDLSNFLVSTANQHGDYPRYSATACQDAQLATAVGSASASVVFYNTSTFHELPIGVYNFFNSIYRKANGGTASMFLESNPMPKTPREEALASSIRSMLIGIIIMIPFTFIPSTFVAWIVKERECKARHLQNVSGLGFGVYWASNFLFDVASFIVTMFLAIVVFLVFDRTEYIGADAIGATILLFLFYGLAGVSFAYLVSFLFNEHSTAQNIVMLVNFIAGFLLVLVVFILGLLESTKDVANILAYIFRLVPSYALGDGIINLAMLDVKKAFNTQDTAWTLDVCGADLLYMAIEFPIALMLTLFVDHPRRRMKTQALLHNPDAPPDTIENEDEDVARERLEVENPAEHHRDGDLVLVKNLRKQYHNGKVAVKNLSFGVHPGEVFGFLGTNGAGKTTAISILCQEFFPTSGHGYIAGHDIVNEAEEALRCIGYCPQFDALLDLLTVEEHLHMYAGVRGIVAEERQRVVHGLAELCELTKYMPTVASELSGGNKRKLSVALSLIGGPSVVFLDEPSAGMDPMARRGLWTAIETVADNCAVVLTTHHLEEVEALAHRVAIMVEGTLRCIGDKPHLKRKYGSGFELSVRIASEDHSAAFEAFVKDNLPLATLNESRSLRYSYALPQDTTLSTMFSLLEKQKEPLHITDYSISQTSIEQVFLRISAEAELQAAEAEANGAPAVPADTTAVPM